MIYLSLGISLAATLLIETGIAWLCKKRGSALLTVVAVNLLTNPVLVLLWHLTAHHPLIFGGMEALAVLIEGCCYRLFPRKFQKPFWFSLLCNAVSCIIGGIL